MLTIEGISGFIALAIMAGSNIPKAGISKFLDVIVFFRKPIIIHDSTKGIARIARDRLSENAIRKTIIAMITL
jgi:hypothetical protein